MYNLCLIIIHHLIYVIDNQTKSQIPGIMKFDENRTREQKRKSQLKTLYTMGQKVRYYEYRPIHTRNAL